MKNVHVEKYGMPFLLCCNTKLDKLVSDLYIDSNVSDRKFARLALCMSQLCMGGDLKFNMEINDL